MKAAVAALKRARKRQQAIRHRPEEQPQPSDAAPYVPVGFLGFEKWAARFLSHHFSDSASKFHAWLKPELAAFHTKREQKLCVIAPRGAAKSTWSTLAYPLYCGVYGLEPYIVIISDTQAQANKFLAAIKTELEHNEQLKADFPEVARQGPVWQQKAIELTNGVRIEAFGKGGKIRGSKHWQYRPTLIILDDPQNLEDTYSEDQLNKDYDWLNSDVMKAGDAKANVLAVGTALHLLCIVCRLEKVPGWRHRKFKSLLAEPANKPLWDQWKEILRDHANPQRDDNAKGFYVEHQADMDAGAEVLWPSREPLYKLQLIRYAEGEHAFAREKQSEPLPPDIGRFQRGWFQPFQDIGDALILGKGYYGKDDLVHKTGLSLTMWVDPANRPKKGSKYTVFHVAATDYLSRVFVLAVFRDKLSLDQLVPEMYAWALRWNVHYIGFEDTGFQLTLVNEANDKRRYPRMPPIKQVAPEGKSKLTRALPAIIKAEQGQVYVPKEGAVWLEDWLTELERFTGDDKLDTYTDQVDTLAYNVLDIQNHGNVASAITA